jgi:uncharacterized membrane protein
MDLGTLRDSFLSFLDNIPVLRAIVGVIIVFFVPGFVWTLALFNKVKITGTNALITIIVITFIGLAIYLVKRLLRRKSRTEEA